MDVDKQGYRPTSPPKGPPPKAPTEAYRVAPYDNALTSRNLNYAYERLEAIERKLDYLIEDAQWRAKYERARQALDDVYTHLVKVEHRNLELQSWDWDTISNHVCAALDDLNDWGGCPCHGDIRRCTCGEIDRVIDEYDM